MVPRKTDNGTTITINCADKCQRVALAGGGVLAAAILIPLLFVLMVIFGNVLYLVFSSLLSCTNANDCAGANFLSIFSTIITFTVAGVAVVCAATFELRQ